MNSLKLNIDLKDEKQVIAMAAFFNTLSGNVSELGKAGAQASKAGEALKESLQATQEDSPKKETPIIDIKTAGKAPHDNTEPGSPEPCNADKDLSFSELKAKFPNTRAKSKDKFLEKLGLYDDEGEHEGDYKGEHEGDYGATKEGETTEEENNEDGEKVDEHLVKKLMSGLLNTKDADLKQSRKKALKARLSEYDAHNVSSIPADKYADFVAFMRGLE